MKQVLSFLLFGVWLACFGGCRTAEPIADVIVEGNGRFPASLAGMWTANKGNWQFVFEPDGDISAAVINEGLIKVEAPTKEYRISLQDFGSGVYELGRWTVQYWPQNRELTVEVVVAHFHLDMPEYVIEGRSRDVFVCPVSEDGRTWRAEWFMFPQITVLNPDPRELRFDPNSNPRGMLTFTKQEAAG